MGWCFLSTDEKPKVYQVCINSDFHEAKNAVNKAIGFLKDNNKNISSDDISDIKLSLNEAVVNAIDHGNQKDVNKNVFLQLRLKENSVTFKVADQGKGFDHVNYISQYDEKHMKENGRGVKLISSLMDSVAFNFLGNEIKFLKKKKKDG